MVSADARGEEREASGPPGGRPGGALATAILALLVVGCAVSFAFARGFEPLTRRDSKGYLEVAARPALEQLMAIRTPGYPALIGAADAIGGDLWALVPMQCAIYLAGVGVLFSGLRRVGASPWVALLCVAPLLVDELLWRYGVLIGPETPSAGFALMAIGVASALAADPSRRAAWIALAASVFAACQMRPAYLFLVGLLPVMAAGLALLRRAGWRRVGALAGGALAASLLPLVLFAGLRGAATGHFGLVSFGGLNLIGLSAPLLSERAVAELPAGQRALAGAMLERRDRIARRHTDGSFTPLEERDFATPAQRYAAWTSEFDTNIYRVALPLAQKAFAKQGLAPELELIWINDQLVAISRALLRARPDLYASWVWSGVRLGLERIARVVHPGSLGLAGAALALGLAGVATRRTGRVDALAPVWIGGGLLAASLLLTVLVQRPLQRYLISTSMLLPGALWATIHAGAVALLPRRARGSALVRAGLGVTLVAALLAPVARDAPERLPFAGAVLHPEGVPAPDEHLEILVHHLREGDRRRIPLVVEGVDPGVDFGRAEAEALARGDLAIARRLFDQLDAVPARPPIVEVRLRVERYEWHRGQGFERVETYQQRYWREVDAAETDGAAAKEVHRARKPWPDPPPPQRVFRRG